jgi:hypothetical protein
MQCIEELFAAFPDPDRQPHTERMYIKSLMNKNQLAVEFAVAEWVETKTRLPKIAELLKLVTEHDEHQREQPAAAAEIDRVAIALMNATSYLAEGHIREIQRLDPDAMQALLVELGEWWAPHMERLRQRRNRFIAERIKAGDPQPVIRRHPREWREDRERINAWIESRLGKTLCQILECEVAAAQGLPPPEIDPELCRRPMSRQELIDANDKLALELYRDPKAPRRLYLLALYAGMCERSGRPKPWADEPVDVRGQPRDPAETNDERRARWAAQAGGFQHVSAPLERVLEQAAELATSGP